MENRLPTVVELLESIRTLVTDIIPAASEGREVNVEDLADTLDLIQGDIDKLRKFTEV
jgi:hypothetical protein